MHKILSIDVGEKRVGLATSDELGITAAPYGYLDRLGSTEKIIDVIERENIGQIIVGIPLLMDGTAGSQADNVHKFVEELHKKTSVPIDFESEILSSVEATNRLKSMKRKIENKGEVDAMAATIILESYMNRRENE